MTNSCAAALFAALTIIGAAHAQSLEGEWTGTLKAGPQELRLALHVAKDSKGVLAATLDSLDQGVMGMTVNTISQEGPDVKFALAEIGGAYEGKLDEAGQAMTGTWTQGGNAMPLSFARAAKAAPKVRSGPPPKPSDIDGMWQATLDTGAGALRLNVQFFTDDDGKQSAKLQSPDQNPAWLTASSVTRDGASVKIEFKAIGSGIEGKFNPDKTTLQGTWTQMENSAPLTFKRTKGA
jgi:hypothetical protein